MSKGLEVVHCAGDYVHVKIWGPLDRSAVNTFLLELSVLARGAGTPRVLLDAFASEGRLSFMEHFDYAEQVANLFRGLRVAVVLNVESSDPQSIAEMVALNRGVELRVFSDAADAALWLGVKLVERAAPPNGLSPLQG